MSTEVLPQVETPVEPVRHLYGLMAEFESQDELIQACEQVRDAGYKEFDAYTPVPIHGLTDAMGWDDNRLQKIVFAGAMTGLVAGFSLMYYITMIAYPMNVGGKPNFSWPAYVPPTFETTILLAAFSAVFGMIGLNGLPMPYHPVFNNPRFEMASTDRYFLCIEAKDPKFDLANTRRLLEGLKPKEVVEVEH